MATSAKRPTVVIKDEEGSHSDENTDESMDEDSNIDEEVNVEFEARTPDGGDLDGIKRLLKQLFLKAHVDVSGLADLILEHSYVGSVIKQCELPEEEMSEDDDDEDPIFGISSIVNLTEKQDVQCLSQIRAIILDQCTKHGTDQTRKLIHDMFNKSNDSSHHVGLILNERLVNIPPQIAAPLLESLSKDMKTAQEKKLPFLFDNYILICKVYKLEDEKNKKTSWIFSKPEEEILSQAAVASFRYSIFEESDSGLEGDWDADDEGMKPYHLVLVIAADSLETIVTKIRSAFVSPT